MIWEQPLLRLLPFPCRTECSLLKRARQMPRFRSVPTAFQESLCGIRRFAEASCSCFKPACFHSAVPLDDNCSGIFAKKGTAADKKIVIAGNTVMQSLAAGLDVQTLGAFPFTPPSYFGKTFDDVFNGTSLEDCGAEVFLHRQFRAL